MLLIRALIQGLTFSLVSGSEHLFISAVKFDILTWGCLEATQGSRAVGVHMF